MICLFLPNHEARNHFYQGYKIDGNLLSIVGYNQNYFCTDHTQLVLFPELQPIHCLKRSYLEYNSNNYYPFKNEVELTKQDIYDIVWFNQNKWQTKVTDTQVYFPSLGATTISYSHMNVIDLDSPDPFVVSEEQWNHMKKLRERQNVYRDPLIDYPTLEALVS